jgi:hypothetical protein
MAEQSIHVFIKQVVPQQLALLLLQLLLRPLVLWFLEALPHHLLDRVQMLEVIPQVHRHHLRLLEQIPLQLPLLSNQDRYL